MDIKTDLIFPPRLIPKLKTHRLAGWRKLLDSIEQAPADSDQRAAFTLTMARHNGCATCTPETTRFALGCLECTLRSLEKLKAVNHDVIADYKKNLKEITTTP
jgi:hypothetical protein